MDWGNTMTTPEPIESLDTAVFDYLVNYSYKGLHLLTLGACKELTAYITEREQKARVQTAVNMQSQWNQERINHTLSTHPKDWKTELDHFNEFSLEFVARLTPPKETKEAK